MANIDDIDDDFILCNICNCEYDEDHRAPKLLPCLHTLCNDCALNAAHGSVLTCALCHKEHAMSSDLEFLKDSTMRNMMDMIKLQRKPSSILCSDCPDNNNGDAFCKECYVFLCKECTSAHKRTQLTRRHSLLTLDELKNAGIGSFTRKEMCSLPGHEEQPFCFYCENDECQKPVCTQCVVGDHSQSNGHVIRSLNEIFEENKLLVERLVGELLGKISEVSSDAKLLESEEAVIEGKHREMNAHIDALFDSFVSLIRNRRDKLKQRVNVICQERQNEIKEQLTQLQRTKSDMENSCNYSSRMLVFTNKPEFLQLKTVVVSKLNKMIDVEYQASQLKAMELNFDACIEHDRCEDIVQNIGEVSTNFYSENARTPPKMNGRADGMAQISDNFKLPYRGSPKHPPGKFTPNKHSELKPTKEIRLVPNVESLKLDLQNDNKPFTKGVKTSPSSENVLGRPLSLKSPVFSPNKQPTSLGEFLNELHYQTREIIREKKYQWMLESQELPDKESSDRQLPKAPLMSPASSPGRQRSPGTPPCTPPVYATQSQIHQAYSTPGNQSYYRAVQSPTQKEVTYATTNGNGKEVTSATTNGNGNGKNTVCINTYPEVKQPSPRKPKSDKLVVFGDISCPDFMMDPSSAHHEREVSSDGRTLRNKKTDIFGSKCMIDIDNSLVQYKGAIGTIPFQDPGKFYYEVDLVYNIQQPLEETWLVFEIGLCRLDDVDMHHTVERHEFARSFYVARYPEDGKLTMEFWHNRDLLNFMPLSDNSPGIEMRITYGFLVDTRRKKWVVADCNNNKVLHSFDMLDFTDALYPVFGCYNPDLCTVEMTLKTGSEITMVPQCLKQPGYRSH